MFRTFFILSFFFCLSLAAWAAPAPASPELERVLNSMDRTSQDFHTAQADFVWEQFQQVVNETDVQKGTIYFRGQGDQVQMAADIHEPDQKYVLFNNNKVRIYQPKIDQVTEYNTGKNKQDFESFLVLGFGGGGHDLLKSFDVTYQSSEAVAGQPAAKLLLVPKSERVKGMFNKIILWIDPSRGISVQQQFFEPSGDYRLTHYNNIKINKPIPDNTFKLRTTGKTKVVRPQG